MDKICEGLYVGEVTTVKAEHVYDQIAGYDVFLTEETEKAVIWVPGYWLADRVMALITVDKDE